MNSGGGCGIAIEARACHPAAPIILSLSKDPLVNLEVYGRVTVIANLDGVDAPRRHLCAKVVLLNITRGGVRG